MKKILCLVRAASGSGKSTLAKKLVKNINGLEYDDQERIGIADHFETDNFFLTTYKKYNFNTELLGFAHDWNAREIYRFFTANQQSTHDLYAVVSNTFTTKKEIRLLLEKLDSFGFRPDIIEVIEPKTEWWLARDINTMICKNSHGVTPEVIQKQLNRWQHIDEGSYEYAYFSNIIKNENSK